MSLKQGASLEHLAFVNLLTRATTSHHRAVRAAQVRDHHINEIKL